MKTTPVPNGPLVKKKGPFKGSTLKNGGKVKVKAGGVLSMLISILKLYNDTFY